MSSATLGVGRPIHVHFGAGALGLGLIGWAARTHGHTFAVATRTIGASPASLRRFETLQARGEYEIDVRSEQQHTVPVAAVLSTDHDSEELGSIIEREDTVVVTTAVTMEGLEALVPTLEALL